MRSDMTILTEAGPLGDVSYRFRCPDCRHLGDWHPDDRAAAERDRDTHTCAHDHP